MIGPLIHPSLQLGNPYNSGDRLMNKQSKYIQFWSVMTMVRSDLPTMVARGVMKVTSGSRHLITLEVLGRKNVSMAYNQ